MNKSSEQAPGSLFDNIGETDAFIFVLEMDIQITSLEVDVNFLGSKQEAIYLELDTFLMHWIKRLQKFEERIIISRKKERITTVR